MHSSILTPKINPYYVWIWLVLIGCKKTIVRSNKVTSTIHFPHVHHISHVAERDGESRLTPLGAALTPPSFFRP